MIVLTHLLKSSLFQLFLRVGFLSLEQRRVEYYQLKPDRADVIVPACDIYSFIFKELKVREFYVPKIGLSDGIVYDLFLNYAGEK